MNKKFLIRNKRIDQELIFVIMAINPCIFFVIDIYCFRKIIFVDVIWFAVESVYHFKRQHPVNWIVY